MRLAALPFLVAVLATAITLGGSFVFDDALILQSAELRAFDLERIFWDNYWGTLRFDTNYRPLPLLTYALNFQVSDAAFGFHLVNVLLHGGVAWLAYRLLLALSGDRALAAVCAALYGALSIRCEAVAWLVGRAEILAAGAVLAGLLVGLREERGGQGAPGRAALLALLTFLGCASKENAVALPALLLLVTWARGGPLAWRGAVASGVGVLAYVLLRQVVLAEQFDILASGAGTLLSQVDNPIHESFVAPSVRMANALQLQGLYLWKTLVPWHLSADYSFDALPVRSVAQALLSPEVALLTAFVGGGFWYFRKRGEPLGTIGVLFFPVAFFVASNLAFGIGTIFGERLAYLPSLGWPLVLCALARPVVSRGPTARRWALGALSLLTLLYGVRTAVRCADWRDPAVLNEVTWESSPASVRAQLLGASVALDSGLREVQPARKQEHFARALDRALRAVEILPGYGRAESRVARIHLERAQLTGLEADYAEAELWSTRAFESLRRARTADPDVLYRRGLARVGLARIRLASGQESAREALTAAHTDFDAYLVQLQAMGRRIEAPSYYYRGLTAAMLAEPLGQAGHALRRAALADFDEALRLDPAQPDFLMRRGTLRATVGELDGAIADLEQGLATCLALGRRFHPRAISAWAFARELVGVRERAGDIAGAERERVRARELRTYK